MHMHTTPSRYALTHGGETIAAGPFDPATVAMLQEYVATERIEIDLGPLDVAELARLERKCAEGSDV